MDGVLICLSPGDFTCFLASTPLLSSNYSPPLCANHPKQLKIHGIPPHVNQSHESVLLRCSSAHAMKPHPKMFPDSQNFSRMGDFWLLSFKSRCDEGVVIPSCAGRLPQRDLREALVKFPGPADRVKSCRCCKRNTNFLKINFKLPFKLAGVG